MEQCGATIIIGGETLRCQRERGHDISKWDRHKVIMRAMPESSAEDTHCAVVWNEPGTDEQDEVTKAR